MSINGLEGDELKQALAQDAVDRAMFPTDIVKRQEETLKKVLAENLENATRLQMEAEARSEARSKEAHQKEVARIQADQRRARRMGVASQLLAAQPLGKYPDNDAEEIRRVLAKTDALLAALEAE